MKKEKADKLVKLSVMEIEAKLTTISLSEVDELKEWNVVSNSS